MVRPAARKDRALVFTQENLPSPQASLLAAQRELEYLHLENASLTKGLADCMTVNLRAVLHSFENVLQ